MALQSCLVAVAALLVCGATARPQGIAVFETINLRLNESAAPPPPRAAAPGLDVKTRGACMSGPVYAPTCSDTFPLTTLEADSAVQFIVPASPLSITPFAYCGWEFQGPSDGQLYITCETASFFFGQYFLVWDMGTVGGVHNQQNVNIQYQFAGSSGRVGVRTLSKSFYAPITCEATFIAALEAPATTEETLPTTEAAPATTEETLPTIEAAPATTEETVPTTEAAPATTEETRPTTEATTTEETTPEATTPEATTTKATTPEATTTEATTPEATITEATTTETAPGSTASPGTTASPE